MNKFTPYIFIILCLVAVAFAEGEAKPATTETGPFPEIVIPEQRFDFGFSPEGYFMVHSYAVKNEGEGELRIQRIRTTCGCTSAPMKKMQLEPGEETEVTVIFNSTRYKHNTSKSAIITSNDPVNRSLRVTFSANMDSTGFLFDIEPRALNIPRGEDPPEKMNFIITNSTGENIELNIVDYSADILAEPELDDKKIKKGGSAELKLALNDDFDPAAHYIKSSVTLEATGAGKSPIRFTIPVKGSGPQ